MEGLVWSRCF